MLDDGAQAAGLNDRGEIAIGLRADLVQARSREGLPVVQQVWRQAKRPRAIKRWRSTAWSTVSSNTSDVG